MCFSVLKPCRVVYNFCKCLIQEGNSFSQLLTMAKFILVMKSWVKKNDNAKGTFNFCIIYMELYFLSIPFFPSQLHFFQSDFALMLIMLMHILCFSLYVTPFLSLCSSLPSACSSFSQRLNVKPWSKYRPLTFMRRVVALHLAGSVGAELVHCPQLLLLITPSKQRLDRTCDHLTHFCKLACVNCKKLFLCN